MESGVLHIYCLDVFKFKNIKLFYSHKIVFVFNIVIKLHYKGHSVLWKSQRNIAIIVLILTIISSMM